MKESSHRFYQWAIEKANSSKAPLWIFFLFALEIILFIPLDAVLLFFCLQNRSKALVLALIAAFASAISGLLGYLIGHFLWDLIDSYIVPQWISASLFNKISFHFQTYEGGAVFLGSLLPFPLKALSVVAGVFDLGALSFTLYLLAARLVRFGLIAIASLFWGEKMKDLLDRHFHRIALAIGAKIAAAFLFLWAFAR